MEAAPWRHVLHGGQAKTMRHRADISEAVCTIVGSMICKPIVDIEEASRLDLLGVTSLDLVEITISVEDEFDILINQDQMESFNTVRDIVNFVEENAS